jgi:aspartate aminotransferase
LRKKNMDKEYAPISGPADFCKHSILLALGDDSQHVAEGRVIYI